MWLAYGADFDFGKSEQIPIKDIDAESLLLLEEGHCLRDHALTSTNLLKIVKDNVFQATSLNTIVQMVDNGLGTTILPKMAIDGGIARGTKIGLRPLFGKETSRQIGFAWRKSSPRQDEYKLLASYFQTELAAPLKPKKQPSKKTGF